MENKQTAVEWLEEKVDNMILNGGDTDLLAVIEHIKQAKAMEQEQIVDAYLEGESDGEHLDNSGENYYNQRYGTPQ